VSDANFGTKPQPEGTFRLLSVAELEKMPPPEWLIEPLLTVDSQAILFGAPGEGKSFVALSFALAVATGRDWLGHKLKQGPVVYIAAEGGRGIGQRVRAWQKENRIDSVESMFFLLAAPQLRESNDLLKLLKTTATLPQNPVLIVIDHSCATLLLAQGVHPKAVQEILGHSQISLTMDTYSTVLPSVSREAAEQMDAVLRA
jgi:hypothetical protein